MVNLYRSLGHLSSYLYFFALHESPHVRTKDMLILRFGDPQFQVKIG